MAKSVATDDGHVVAGSPPRSQTRGNEISCAANFFSQSLVASPSDSIPIPNANASWFDARRRASSPARTTTRVHSTSRSLAVATHRRREIDAKRSASAASFPRARPALRTTTENSPPILLFLREKSARRETEGLSVRAMTARASAPAASASSALSSCSPSAASANATSRDATAVARADSAAASRLARRRFRHVARSEISSSC